MAEKKILGIDIGHEQLKMVLVKGKKVKRAVSVEMPQDLIQEGKIVSVEALGDLLRKTMRENKIRCKKAAIIMESNEVYVLTVMMPIMSEKQLVYNLPFEFRDYIEDDHKKYLFDYSMLSTQEDIKKILETPVEEGNEDEEARQMELLAVAAHREYVDQLKNVARRAGLKLRKAAPVIFAYEALIQNRIQKTENPEEEYCFVDIGHTMIRMYIFKGDKYKTTREIDMGLALAEQRLAEERSIDIPLAHTYLEKNYEDCWSSDVCMNVWNSISIELMRSLNFYRFSNPNSTLEAIWLFGGGADINVLQQQIERQLRMTVHTSMELLTEEAGTFSHGSLMLQAYGITQN